MSERLKNITLNGKPLADLLIKRRRGPSARTSPGQVVYTADQKAQKVRIAGMVFPWHAKAPYVKSGHSILGGIELTEDEEFAKCHECGGWFRCIGSHLGQCKRSDNQVAHARSREYRGKHGIGIRTSLSGTSSKATRKRVLANALASKPNYRISVRGNINAAAQTSKFATGRYLLGQGFSKSPELDNLRASCKAQLTHKVIAVARELGRTPTYEELRGRQISPTTIRRVFGDTFNGALKEMGLFVRGRGVTVANSPHTTLSSSVQ